MFVNRCFMRANKKKQIDKEKIVKLFELKVTPLLFKLRCYSIKSNRWAIFSYYNIASFSHVYVTVHNL